MTINSALTFKANGVFAPGSSVVTGPGTVSSQGTVNLTNGKGATVASTHTDSAGRYSLSVPPATYTLTVDTGSQFPRCPPSDVTVKAAQRTRADVDCDTGIR